MRAELKSRNRQALFFKKQFSTVQPSSKATWRLINEVTNRKRATKSVVATSDSLADHFSSIVSDPSRPAALSVQHGPAQATDFYSFQVVTYQDVHDLLSGIDPSKATGNDDIPGIVLKNLARVFTPSLLRLINLSLARSYVPRIWKIANVCPLHKSGDATQPMNYRPVSLLPVVSKLLERALHAQLVEYLERQHLFPQEQFAYRSHCSTEDALLHASDCFLRAKDQGEHTGVVLVDLSKAFDKVRHHPLVDMLYELGIRGQVLQWFASYLTNRQQRICVRGRQPTSLSTCGSGVPQGSVLGPLLYVLYTREIPSVVRAHGAVCQLYTDDILLRVF